LRGGEHSNIAVFSPSSIVERDDNLPFAAQAGCPRALYRFKTLQAFIQETGQDKHSILIDYDAVQQ
jgi:hypothetical protein